MLSLKEEIMHVFTYSLVDDDAVLDDVRLDITEDILHAIEVEAEEKRGKFCPIKVVISKDECCSLGITMQDAYDFYKGFNFRKISVSECPNIIMERS